MDKLWLVKLCSRTWSIRALALMAGGCPARVSPLAEHAGCGRTAMGATVAHLQELGLLERNPGYGHPLRPEYRLTPVGLAVASWASGIDQLMKSPDDLAIYRGKWALPVMSTLDPIQRYSSVKKMLAPVTDRALSICLGRLQQRRWVTRVVCGRSTPPSVSYKTLVRGEKLHRHLSRLPPLQELR